MKPRAFFDESSLEIDPPVSKEVEEEIRRQIRAGVAAANADIDTKRDSIESKESAE